MNDLMIAGSAGEIEARVNPVSGSRAMAVLCHPHPLYGGSMDDGVLAHIAEGFERAGVSQLRFNFRGVGASAGEYDRGTGEALDVEAVAAFAVSDPDSCALMLGGYSFGAGIVFRAAASISPVLLVLVAPPVQMIESLPVPPCRMLVLLGQNDQMVDCDTVAAHFATHPHVRVHIIPGADHFFYGAGALISGTVEAFVHGA